MLAAANQLRPGDFGVASAATAARMTPAITEAASPADGFAARMRQAQGPPSASPAPASPRPADRLELREQLRRVPIRPASSEQAAAIADPRAAARRSAEQMVASLFVQPLLDMALESDAGGPFAPGTGEKTFGPLLNQRLADEIVRKARLPLVDAVVEQVLTGTGEEPTDG